MRTADEETTRVNYSIFRRQDKALRDLDKKTPVKGGISGHVRIAIDNYLDMSPEEREREVPKHFQHIITLLEYMKMKIAKGKKMSEWNISKGEMMTLGFGKYWYEFSAVVEMMVHSLGMKKIDVLHESVVAELEGSQDRVRKERLGFKIVFMVPVTRNRMCQIRNAIEDDLKHFGRVKPLVNGEKLGE